MDVLLRLAVFVFGWGWVLLVAVGLVLLATLPGSARQKRRIVGAVFLFGLAFAWQQVTKPLNFGVTYEHIRTQKGEMEAFVRHKGFVAYWLVVRQSGREQEIWLSNRVRPTRVFWIQEGKTIGVAYPDRHLIVDVQLLADPTIGERALSADEEQRLDYQRQLTPEEERAFEAAEKAADAQ